MVGNMEEEDKLLSRLGVVSANPDDIERHVLSKVKSETRENDVLENKDEANAQSISDREDKSKYDISAEQVHIYSQLRAIEAEIEAVGEGLEAVQNAANKNGSEPENSESDTEDLKQNLKNQKRFLVEGGELQQALAVERLRSLRQKKKELEEQLQFLKLGSGPQDSDVQKLLHDLVKDEKANETGKSNKRPQSSNKKKRNYTALQEDTDFDAALDAASVGFIETERDKLIRHGVLTPFDQVKGFERRVERTTQASDNNHSVDGRQTFRFSTSAKSRPSIKLLDAEDMPKLDPPNHEFRRIRKSSILKDNDSKDDKNVFKVQTSELRKRGQSTQINEPRKRRRRPLAENRWRKAVSKDDEQLKLEYKSSDGSLEVSLGENISHSREEECLDSDYKNDSDEEAGPDDSCKEDFVTLEGGLKIPGKIYDSLFDYQKTGVKWLWELHCQKAGGIIGDEMGLGKTIQVISFLAALHFSGLYKRSIVVCPLTLLRQWRREVRKWYPKLHVTILHDSVPASNLKRKSKQNKDSDVDEALSDSEDDEEKVAKGSNKWDYVIHHIMESQSELVITTYEQLRILRDKLLAIDWGYAVLDEGHRIRNPNAEITLVCKQLPTVHRIIMTGAPIQNKLTELWSLFDFVFPGKLGVLPVFEAQFAAPIAIGGYANANPLQVSTAYRCAVVLRDLIMPYLLRRMKTDVNAQLTKKTEHVLFCSLTEVQQKAYRAFLASSDVEQILEGSRNSLYGIDVLRKICNHPDLLERDQCSQHPDYGNVERSGKMKLVAQILKVWKEQGHRVLIFTQTQQMLDIIENYLISECLEYRRMDGLTPAKQRTALMDEFNQSTHVFVFILTTKVGGLGTNLIGADRVIIFDPDWNPSTDMQARERAWRIGQTRDVTVYRLITRGTIEEKVYHRQIYKYHLTNKILKNPRQRRFFKARDMRDLFTLQEDLPENKTETSNLFNEFTEELKVEGRDSLQAQSRFNLQKQNSPMSDKINEDGNLKLAKNKGKEKVEREAGTSSTWDESQILKSLLGNGMHSALDHDAILRINDEEKDKVDDEASVVAQRAAAALRESRVLRHQDDVSIPTWTGKSGVAGAPDSVRKRFGSAINNRLASSSKSNESSFANAAENSSRVLAGASAGKALSSGDLLTRIRQNRENAINAGLAFQQISEGPLNPGNNITRKSELQHRPPVSIQPEILIRQICTFIQQKGGCVCSAEIVEHFKDKIPAKDLSLFKKLLREIAILNKEGGGGKWVLKEEYQVDRSSAG